MTNQRDDEIEHIYLDEEDHHPKSPVHHEPAEAIESKTEYRRFYRFLVGILVFSTLLSIVRGWDVMRWVADFMAVFFITFAAFKFNDIESFVPAYRQFDILSKKFRPWAYMYPFVEAFLGFWYLLSEAPLRLNVITMAVMGVAAYGIRNIQKTRSRHQSAFSGKYIRLPIMKVSYIENVTMFGLAFLMIILNAIL